MSPSPFIAGSMKRPAPQHIAQKHDPIGADGATGSMPCRDLQSDQLSYATEVLGSPSWTFNILIGFTPGLALR